MVARTDFTSIDLSTLSAIIRDNMNKTIDISQYIASNCDFLKKNCSFKGDVNLEEGEYILQVRICNTTSACETKEVRFTVFPIKPGSWIDIVLKWITRVRCDYSLWATLSGSGCNSADDPDKDCIRNISGCDNCPGVANADQSDWNKNGKGDACEDSDGDGIMDEDEIKRYNTSPSNKDTEGDGVDDKMEILWGTDPNKKDTDGDGISDGDEINKWGTSPLNKDSNHNGIDDCTELGGVLENSVIPLMLLDGERQCSITSEPPKGKDGIYDAVRTKYLIFSYFIKVDFIISGEEKYSKPEDCHIKRMYDRTEGSIRDGLVFYTIDTIGNSQLSLLEAPLIDKGTGGHLFSDNIRYEGSREYRVDSGSKCDTPQPKQTGKELINSKGIILDSDFLPNEDAVLKMKFTSDKEIYKVGSVVVNNPLGFDIEIPDIVIPAMKYKSANRFTIRKDYEYKEGEIEGSTKDYKYSIYITFIPFKIKESENINADTNFLYPPGASPSVSDDIINTENYENRTIKYEIELTGDSVIDGIISKDLIWLYSPYYPSKNSPVKIEWTDGYSTTTSPNCFLTYYSPFFVGSPYVYGKGVRQGIKIYGLPSKWYNPQKPKYYDESIGRKVINVSLCGELGSSGSKERMVGTSPFVIKTYFPVIGEGAEGLSWNHQKFPNETESIPNFYYYWRNTKADCDIGNHSYVIDCSSGDSTIIKGYYDPGDNIFHFCAGAHSDLWYTKHRGIDAFAEICLHEKHHKDSWKFWWPNGYDKSRDLDDDWVPDEFEENAGLDSHETCSCNETLCKNLLNKFGKEYATDYECLAYINMNNWSKCSAIDEDYSEYRYYNLYDYCK